MQTVLRSFGLAFAAVTVGLLILSPSAPAQTKERGNKALDKSVYESVGNVINHGADLFNNYGDYAGCYHAYRAGLIAVRPFLAHRPDLQKAIDEGLAAAEERSRVIARAFVLRRVLGNVRKRVASGGPSAAPAVGKVTPEKAPKPKGIAEKKPETKQEKKIATTKTLWERLGGEAGVRKVVDEFAALAGPDPKVNLTRNGRYKLDDKTAKLLKQRMVEFISAATGGPLKYTGKNMKGVHKGMGITNAEFNATAADLKKALEKQGVSSSDISELLRIVGTTRRDVVEVKKKIDLTKPTEQRVPEKKIERKKGEKLREKKAPPAAQKTAHLSGKISYDGKPAAGWYVTLASTSATLTFSTFIDADGSYAFRTPIPPGNYTVVIEEGLRDKRNPRPRVAVPDRYQNPVTSGLSIQLQPGRQVHDIELK